MAEEGTKVKYNNRTGLVEESKPLKMARRRKKNTIFDNLVAVRFDDDSLAWIDEDKL